MLPSRAATHRDKGHEIFILALCKRQLQKEQDKQTKIHDSWIVPSLGKPEERKGRPGKAERGEGGKGKVR